MKHLLLLLVLILSNTLVFGQSQDEALYHSVVKNDVALTKKLLDKGANPNFVMKKGMVTVTPLITAVNNKNLEMVKLLIAKKADVHLVDGFYTSAIMYAAGTGNLEITQFLIDNGANLNDKDGVGNTVLSAAKESENSNVIALIEGYLKQGIKGDSVHTLIEKGDKSCKDEEDYHKGIFYYTQALEHNTLKAKIYTKRGGAYFYLEDFPNAVADYSAAIAENPDDIADVYFLRGLSKSLLDTEDVVGACEDFRKAKSLGYSMKDLNGLNDYCGDKDLEE